MKRLLLAVLPVAMLAATFCVVAGELPGAGVLPAGGNGGERPPPPKDKNIARIGKVYWHKKERRLEVSGKVCLDSGPLEFLAVLKGGKEYESVLSFDCSAIDLNVAMIGAGYKAAGGVKKIGDPEVPKGDPVYLFVEWKDAEGKTRRVRAEDLLWNQVTKKPMRKTAWVFSGSSFRRDPETKKLYFMAEEEKKLIAVYRDPSAMFNSPLDTGIDDVFYVVNAKAMPKPLRYECPRHADVTAKEPGKCTKCETGTPLLPVGREVKLILEPAPKSALDAENLKDGADKVKPGGGENPPNYKPVPVPGGGKEGEGKGGSPEAPAKKGADAQP